MSVIQRLVRRFKIGATVLADPAPDLEPLAALRLYEPTYPFLAHATLDEGSIEGDQLVYTVRKPPAQTKGRRAAPPPCDATAARRALAQWADAAPKQAPTPVATWRRLADVLQQAIAAPPAAIDPFLIPLA